MASDEARFTLVSPGYRLRRPGGWPSPSARSWWPRWTTTTWPRAGRRRRSSRPREAAELSEAAALHLMELLEEGLPAADLSEAVTDAAVVFLIAMKRHGISDPKRIPACTVMWNLHSAQRARVHIAS